MSDHPNPGERVVPLSEAQKFADEDPILERMIRKGLPLSRDTYLTLAWGVVPKDWDAEHEAEVPECFQLPLVNQRRPPGA